MKTSFPRESGFSIIELLVSLALIGVLVAASMMGVRLATASREAGIHKTDLHQRLRVFHEHFKATLGSANLIFIPAPSQSLLEEDEQTKSEKPIILAFEGYPDSVRFVTFSGELMGGDSSPWMHEVRFYLRENEDTGTKDLLLNERDFAPDTFFLPDSKRTDTSQTLRIVQDIDYLRFRYYYRILENGKLKETETENPVKSSDGWTDKFITEPIDFKSAIPDTENTDDQSNEVRVPKAIEITVGIWNPDHGEENREKELIELPAIVIPIHVGTLFKLPEEEGEEGETATE